MFVDSFRLNYNTSFHIRVSFCAKWPQHYSMQEGERPFTIEQAQWWERIRTPSSGTAPDELGGEARARGAGGRAALAAVRRRVLRGHRARFPSGGRRDPSYEGLWAAGEEPLRGGPGAVWSPQLQVPRSSLMFSVRAIILLSSIARWNFGFLCEFV